MELKGNQKRGSHGKFEPNPAEKPARSLKSISAEPRERRLEWYDNPLYADVDLATTNKCRACDGLYEYDSPTCCGDCDYCGDCCPHEDEWQGRPAEDPEEIMAVAAEAAMSSDNDPMETCPTCKCLMPPSRVCGYCATNPVEDEWDNDEDGAYLVLDVDGNRVYASIEEDPDGCLVSLSVSMGDDPENGAYLDVIEEKTLPTMQAAKAWVREWAKEAEDYERSQRRN